MNLNELLKSFVLTELSTDIVINHLCLDSRRVTPGDLFFACVGAHLHGKTFIADAIKKGARAVCVEINPESCPQKIEFINNVPIIPIVDLSKKLGAIASQFYGDPSAQLKVVGVTGTNGKSSICYMTMMALQNLGMRGAMIGTLGVGFPESFESSPLTTPDPITLQKTLARLLEQGAKVVAMEVSSHALDQYRVDGVHFKLGVFTNLTRDHLDYHGTMDNYGRAKAALFDRLKPEFSLLNEEDSFGAALIKKLEGENVYAYTCHEPDKTIHRPRLIASKVKSDSFGLDARVTSPWGQFQLTTNHIGEFNVGNLLAVSGILGILGFSVEKMGAALSRVPCVPGRMQAFSKLSSPTVVVDYSHTPDALEKVLAELRRLCKGRLYCIFGCGGERDRGKRPMMAAAAEKFSDAIVVTSDNPRHENPEQIMADILAGFSPQAFVTIELDRVKAITDAINVAGKDDVILVAGKGHETVQWIGDEQRFISDIKIVSDLLEGY